jgi:hypothetical protein
MELVCKDPLTTKTLKPFAEIELVYRFVPDIPGMVSARIISMIINALILHLEKK